MTPRNDPRAVSGYREIARETMTQGRTAAAPAAAP